MPESGVQVTVKSTATSDALKKLAAQLVDRRVPNRQLAIQMSSWVARNFAAQGALGGAPWARLSPDYAKRKAKKYGPDKKILEASGLLRGSFQQFGYDNDSATVGSAVTYAEYHEAGGTNLPRRPMLPPPAQALRDAVDVYQNFIARSRGQAGL